MGFIIEYPEEKGEAELCSIARWCADLCDLGVPKKQRMNTTRPFMQHTY
jgi:hypothetical protein